MRLSKQSKTLEKMLKSYWFCISISKALLTKPPLLVLLIQLLWIFNGCTNKRSEFRFAHNEPVKIPVLENFTDSIHISQLIELDSVLPIKDSKNGIGDVLNAFIVGSHLLVHTEDPSTLLLINFHGEIIAQMLEDGVHIKNLTSIDVFDNKVFILDRSQMKVILCDYELKFLDEIPLDFFAQSLKVIDTETLAFYSGNEVTINSGKLILFNTRSKTIVYDTIQVSDRQRKYFNFLTKYHFLRDDNELLFWESSSNNILGLDDSTFSVKYQIDYGAHGVAPDFYETVGYQNPIEFVTDMRKRGVAHRHFEILSNMDHLIITFEKGNDIITCHYDIRKDASQSFRVLVDDLISGTSLFSQPEFMITLLQPNRILGFVPGKSNVFDSERDAIIFGHFK